MRRVYHGLSENKYQFHVERSKSIPSYKLGYGTSSRLKKNNIQKFFQQKIFYCYLCCWITILLSGKVSFCYWNLLSYSWKSLWLTFIVTDQSIVSCPFFTVVDAVSKIIIRYIFLKYKGWNTIFLFLLSSPETK